MTGGGELLCRAFESYCGLLWDYGGIIVELKCRMYVAYDLPLVPLGLGGGRVVVTGGCRTHGLCSSPIKLYPLELCMLGMAKDLPRLSKIESLKAGSDLR